LLFLSVLAGVAAARLWRSWAGVVLTTLVVAAATKTAWAEPFVLNQVIGSPGLSTAPAYLVPSASLPRIYRFAATLPRDAVLVELPFGDLAYEIRYTYFTALHGRRVLNGYSGILPPSYLARVVVLSTHLVEDVRELCQAMAIMDHGRIVRQGHPGDLVAGLAGRVWERPAETAGIPAPEPDGETPRVISVRRLAGQRLARVLADAPPDARCRAVEPSLEDVYFLHVGTGEANAP